jgi:hypothetical protein
VRLRALIAAIVVSLSGSQAWSQADPSYAEEFSCSEVRLPRTIGGLRKLGVLQNEKIIDETDWGSYKTHERRLQFEGLVIEVVTFTNGHLYLLSSISITSRVWRMAPGFRIGQPVEAALAKRGFKGVRNGNDITVAGDADVLTLRVKDGKLVAIMYGCYTG